MHYPIPRHELEADRASLSQWQSPAEFAGHVAALKHKAGPVQVYNDPQSNFVRDAWVAAKLATALAAEAVRLVPDIWPDCELRIGKKVRKYEITIADLKGRRGGDEYKAAATSEPRWEVDDWATRANHAPDALRRAAEVKAGKGYPKSAGLVIYLNLSEYGWKRKEIEAVMHEATAAAATAFLDVWVLWDGRLYLVWVQTERAEIVLP
jgi:hypothetical protein